MYLSRIVTFHIEALQAYAWMKPSNLPSYLPYVYRGFIAFATINAILLLVVHYIIKHRLQAFAMKQLKPVPVRA